MSKTTNNNHNKHDHVDLSCQHSNIKYCKHCQVPHCLDCGKEWRVYNWTYTTSTIPYYNYNTYQSGIRTLGGGAGGVTSGVITSSDVVKAVQPITECDHVEPVGKN